MPKLPRPLFLRLELLVLGAVVAGVALIEYRTWQTPARTLVARVPTAVYLWTAAFHSERLEWVAVSDLKANSRLRATDLKAPDGLDPALQVRLPRLPDRVNKFLKAGIPKGRVVLAGNLSDEPAVDSSGNYLVTLSVPVSNEARALLVQDGKLALTTVLPDPAIKATVVGGPPPPPPPAPVLSPNAFNPALTH